MTRSKSLRIPASLKKKLQANLEKLSIKEAGRLLLIYIQEANKKDHSGEYPPLKELWAAWNDRLAKSRGKPEEAQVVAEYNGLVFLQHLIAETNDFATSAAVAFNLDAFRISAQIERVLQLSALSEVAQQIQARIYDDLPKPVSREDYDRILEWARRDSLISLADAAETLRFDWIQKQDLTTIEIPYDRLKAKAEEDGRDWKELRHGLDEESRSIRRQYAEDLGLLETAFNGDKDRLEHWVKYPVFTQYVEFSEAELDAKTDEFYEKLEALLASGELEGGEGVVVTGYEVLIRDGKIPALFALRGVWDTWVEGQGFEIDNWWPDPIAPHGIGKIYDPKAEDEKELDRDTLEDLVAGFLKDVKGRPWGKGLADLRKSHMKPAALVDFLIREADPLLQMEIDKPDWGMVDFETFANSERTKYARTYEAGPVATIASLNKVAASLAESGEPVDFSHEWIEEQYYPTKDPKRHRESFALIFSMLDALDVKGRPITFRQDEESIASFFGVKLTTPLEAAVDLLRSSYAEYVSYRQAVNNLAAFYFEGLPLIFPEQAEKLQQAEDLFEAARQDLDLRLHRLNRYPWKIDFSSLRIDDPKPDEDRIADYTDRLLDTAKIRSRVSVAELNRIGLQYND